MDVFHLYTFATSAYTTIQALPLLLTPKLIVSLLASEPRRITDLETYLCRTQGLLLLAFAALTLLLTGSIPSTNSWDAPSASAVDSDGLAKNPYALPTLVVTTTYHALTAFYVYTNITYGWSFAFGSALVFSTLLFCMGGWVIMFGSGKGRLSKKTGADKRTGNFPFTNNESASAIKKEAKREKEDKEGRKEGSSKRRSVARMASGR